MNTDVISAVFRKACSLGMIRAWSAPSPGFWYVQPLEGPTQQWDWKDAHDYAEMLYQAGATP